MSNSRIPWPDLRRNRAMQFTAAVMNKVGPYIRDETGHEMRDAHDALFELFFQEGVDVITDHDRAEAGLPPRGPDGRTVEEMVALEARRLEMLTRPLAVFVPADFEEVKAG